MKYDVKVFNNKIITEKLFNNVEIFTDSAKNYSFSEMISFCRKLQMLLKWTVASLPLKRKLIMNTRNYIIRLQDCTKNNFRHKKICFSFR